MEKKIYVSVVFGKIKNGTGKLRIIGISKEANRFIDFARNIHPNFEIRPEQVKVMEAFFKLGIGEGKTTLINLLAKYDK